MPTALPANSWIGQIGFNRSLNYPWVVSNDAGNQIFLYLRMAIADALQLDMKDVINYGLKPAETFETKGFIQTLAVFVIPGSPLNFNDTLANQMIQPASPFYHNKNQTVNVLTSLVDSSTFSEYGSGKLGGSGNNVNNPGASATDGPAQGGAMGGDMAASHPVNGTAAGVAAGAVIGALAYGAAMFFVARRYREKRLAHKRSNSIANSSRYTYGSVGGLGGNAWMSGARNGRLTPGMPGSRGSQGSDSSNGRSVRTQQISAPVMAENSLGWN
jgi:hypothetical protein